MVSRLFTLVFALLSVRPTLLPAQTPLASRPRVEVGLNGVLFGGFLDLLDLRDDLQSDLGGPSPFLRINLSERFAFEGSATLDRIDGVRVTVFEGSLFWRHVRSGKSWFRFTRFGMGARYELDHVRESRRENEDRTISVWPAYDRHKLTAPNFAAVGSGLQWTASPHLALVTELDLVAGPIGVGLRASAGLAVPIGSYGSR